MIDYVAAPYSHPSAMVRDQRMHMFWEAMAALVREGRHPVSPMSLVPLARYGLPDNWPFWTSYSLNLIKMVAAMPGSRLVVVMANEWESSSGVRAEIEAAQALNLPTVFRNPYEPRPA